MNKEQKKLELYAEQNTMCAKCNGHAAPKELKIEHVKDDQFQLVCIDCNIKKQPWITKYQVFGKNDGKCERCGSSHIFNNLTITKDYELLCYLCNGIEQYGLQKAFGQILKAMKRNNKNAYKKKK